MSRRQGYRNASPGRFELLRYRLRAVFVGPFLLGAIVAAILAFIPQSREIYLAILYEPQIVQGILGLAMIVVLCVQLDCWHRMLGIAAIDRTYPAHADPDVDVALDRWNKYLGRIAAFLPMIGLGVGIAMAIYTKGRAENQLSPSNVDTSIFPLALSLILLAALIAWMADWVVRRAASTRAKSRRLVRWTTRTLGAVSAAAVVVPLFPQTYDAAVPFAQFIGPIAAGMVVCIVGVSILTLLSYCSIGLRFPVVSSALFLVVLWVVGNLFQQMQDPAIAENQFTPKETKKHMFEENTPSKYFDKWLASRPDRSAYNGDKPYPVFIVAAQGGGIYASTTALAFLTSMQEDCSAFAQHVFAISGVSGGAVGSAIFNGLATAKIKPVGVRDQPCRALLDPSTGATRGPLVTIADEIVKQDHLSGALLQIWPDFVRKIASMMTKLTTGRSIEFTFDRSTAIERSVTCAFEKSVAEGGRQSWLCPSAHRGDDGLRIPFEKHWSPESIAPSLILNTTWAETGFRASFAPYQLYALSDQTHYRFRSGSNTGSAHDDFKPFHFVSCTRERSLVEAAFISARFPGLVPAYPTEFVYTGKTSGSEGQDTCTGLDNASPESKRLWNFVDGGYVDNSGATSALELYSHLEKYIESDNSLSRHVKLNLVLLTDVTTDQDLADVETGTTYEDTVAPLTALLNVRSQLANRAVLRAIKTLEPEATKEDLAGRGKSLQLAAERKVLVVNLKQRAYDFPLGWRISPVTHEFIHQLLGESAKCKPKEHSTLPPDDPKRVTNDNSCVKKQIREVLLKRAPQQ